MVRTEERDAKWLFPFVKYEPNQIKKRIPLVIQLHGAGERGYGREDLPLVETHGFAKMLTKEEYECMVVMPQCPPETFWVAKVESLLKFVDQLLDAYEIDEDRIYLTGLSMGGYGTWYTAMANPNRFAAIAPVCGGGMAWNADVLCMPIWTFHGVEDNVVSVLQTDEMVEQLILKEKNVKYSRMKGVGHHAWEHAYNKELMEWLLALSRG